MLEFSEYTIYGDNDLEHTDGTTDTTLEKYCRSLSYRIDWDNFTEEDDMVAVIRVNDNECTGALLPGETSRGMWLDRDEWKTGKNTTY